MADGEYRIEGAAESRDALRAVVSALLVGARRAGEPLEVLGFLVRVRDGLDQADQAEPIGPH